MNSIKIYHQLTNSSLQSVLSKGLRKTSRGAKGDNDLIIKTDAFLDKYIPEELKKAGVSRNNNIYGYIGTDQALIDIKDGASRPLSEKIQEAGTALLHLSVTPSRCYISDIDLYDEIKAAIKNNRSEEKVMPLVFLYWKRLIPLPSFSLKRISRPEAMITYDIPPDCITVLGPRTI